MAYDPLGRLPQQRQRAAPATANKNKTKQSSFEAADVVDKMPWLANNNNKKS